MVKHWLLVVLSTCWLATMVATAADLGTTTVELDGRNMAATETALGNFLADALRTASGADVAIVHAMAVHANALIPKGSVSPRAMQSCLASPTGNVTTLKLTPAQLREVFQRALAKFPASNTAFLQVSGMTVTFDSTKPAATRVQSIIINGAALDFADNKATYTVAMPRELADGAVGYFAIFNDEVLKTRKVTETTLLDAVTQEFTRQKGEISPAVEGRLKDVKPKP